MKFLRILVLFLIFSALQLGLVLAQETNPSLLYESGKFSEALTQWESKAQKSATDYYNIGNAYYRTQNLRKALAYYEKALAMASTSEVRENARFNLEIVESQLRANGLLQSDPSLWGGRIVPFFHRLPASVIWISLGLAFLALDLALWRGLRQKKTFRESLLSANSIVALVIVSVSLTLLATYSVARATPLGVIVGDPTAARSGPSQQFTELFKLYPGTRVRIADSSREGWVQIRFAPNGIAWVSEKDVLPL